VSSSPQVTEALKCVSFYTRGTKDFQNLLPTAGRCSAGDADIRHVGKQHWKCR